MRGQPSPHSYECGYSKIDETLIVLARGKSPSIGRTVVAYLLTPRKGWENERLAEYLLSRFSFVAQPSSIADDLGSDFFCTIFKIIDASGRDSLIPRSSFAIQVKSSVAKVSVDNKIDYLLGLELPFFIGVVRQSPPEMSIYSAELLPVLFSESLQP